MDHANDKMYSLFPDVRCPKARIRWKPRAKSSTYRFPRHAVISRELRNGFFLPLRSLGEMGKFSSAPVGRITYPKTLLLQFARHQITGVMQASVRMGKTRTERQ